MAKLEWWKWLCIGLLLYALNAGMLLDVPRKFILNESIRNLYYHVPMWFGMVLMMLLSVIYSVRYLRRQRLQDDAWASALAHVGLLMGMLGMGSGMLWAQYTWGSFWNGDPKQTASAVGLLIYLAYMLLRNSFADEQQRGRISAIYNIFAFATFIPLLFILPRLTDSLHPGNGGNPGFNAYDLDNQMRLVFYPAVIGWCLLGVWVAQVRMRMQQLQDKQEEHFLQQA